MSLCISFMVDIGLKAFKYQSTKLQTFLTFPKFPTYSIRRRYAYLLGKATFFEFVFFPLDPELDTMQWVKYNFLVLSSRCKTDVPVTWCTLSWPSVDTQSRKTYIEGIHSLKRFYQNDITIFLYPPLPF